MSSENPAFGPVAAHYDELMAGVPYRYWVRYLAQLWERHGTAPGTVLDLACGTGTVSRLLSSQGHQVVGVDLSAAMLARARQEAVGIDPPIEFIQQDAAELDLGGRRFDAVVCLFDSLNYLLKPERLASAFARVFGHLEPGGSFIFDLNTEYALAQGMFNQSSARHGEALHYRWRSRYDPASRLCTVSMRFSYTDPTTGETQVFHETHRQRAYDREEVLGWLHDAGFAEVFVYDSYTTEPPKKRSDRLFYVALKNR